MEGANLTPPPVAVKRRTGEAVRLLGCSLLGFAFPLTANSLTA
jgi:hypothetical protein